MARRTILVADTRCRRLSSWTFLTLPFRAYSQLTNPVGAGNDAKTFVISFDNTQNRRALDNHWSDWRKLSGLVGAGEIAYAMLTFGTDVAGRTTAIGAPPKFFEYVRAQGYECDAGWC